MNLFRWFQPKSVAPEGRVVFSEARDPIRTPASYIGFSREGYRKNVIAFRCINLIADACASVPWLLYKMSRTGKKIDVHEHEVLGLLKKPAPNQTSSSFQAAFFRYFLISGNGYIQAVGAKNDPKPRELWALQPDKMRVVPGEGGLPQRYEYRPNFANVIEFPVSLMGASAIHHQKTFNPETIWEGMSPIEAAALGIDALNSGGTWNLKLIQNSAKPSMFIKVEGNVSEAQFQTLVKDAQEKYEGPWRAGKPIVLRNAEVKPVSWSPLEMDWLNSKKTSEKDVALVFGVPSQLVGVEDSQKFDNYEQARLAFYQDTVLPLKKMQAEGLGLWLLPAWGAETSRMELGIDEEAIDALEPIRKERWERAEKATTLSTNEKRELQGYGKYITGSQDPGDRILVPTALIPLESAAADVQAEPVTDTQDQTGIDPEVPGTPPPADPIGGDDGEKSTETKSKAGRHRYWLARDRAKLAASRGIEEKATALFQKERDRMAERLTGVSPWGYDAVIGNVLAEMEPVWRAMLKTEMTDIARRFGRELLEQAKSFPGATETKAPKDRFEFTISRFLDARINSTTEKMARTTLGRVKKALVEAESVDDDGHEIQVDVAKTVRGSYGKWSGSRASSLSRTETHVAAEGGTLEAAKALQLPSMKKEWVSVQDARVRDSHEKVDGTQIELNETFRVDLSDGSGSEDMTGPGDQNASAGNTINCRCVLVYGTGDAE